jgi:hypothetical protein
MKRVAGFALATIALKMSGYRWASRAPMPFAALSSVGWKLNRAIIVNALAQLPKQKWLLVDGGNCTGYPLLHEVFGISLPKEHESGVRCRGRSIDK